MVLQAAQIAFRPPSIWWLHSSFLVLAAALGLTKSADIVFMLWVLAALAAGACCTIVVLHTAYPIHSRFHTIQLSSMLCLG